MNSSLFTCSLIGFSNEESEDADKYIGSDSLSRLQSVVASLEHTDCVFVIADLAAYSGQLLVRKVLLPKFTLILCYFNIILSAIFGNIFFKYIVSDSGSHYYSKLIDIDHFVSCFILYYGIFCFVRYGHGLALFAKRGSSNLFFIINSILICR